MVVVVVMIIISERFLFGLNRIPIRGRRGGPPEKTKQEKEKIELPKLRKTPTYYFFNSIMVLITEKIYN